MAEESTTAVAAEAVAPAKAAPKKRVAKKPAAKAAAKKAPKKAAKKTAKKKAPKAKAAGESGLERSRDVKWTDKKVLVYKALKKMGAVGVSNAKSMPAVAEKAGVTAHDIRHFVYHGRAVGYTDVAEVEGIRGYAVYLTAKGAKLDPAAELKKQQAG